MVRTRNVWMAAALSLTIGVAGTLFYVLNFMTYPDLVSARCSQDLALDWGSVATWDARFGEGKGERAKELCELIVGPALPQLPL